MRLQECILCDHPTGRTTEDSLYHDDAGPLCEECYKERVEDGERDRLPCQHCKELQATITACEAEVSRVYLEITNGRFSKMNTEAGHILDFVRELREVDKSDLKAANRRIDGLKESLFHLNQQLKFDTDIETNATAALRTQLTAVTAERDRLRDEAAKDEWICFHCGFSTTDHAEAKAHFGDRDEEEPLCLTWKDLCEHGQANEFQSALQQLDAEQFENANLRTKIEGLEYRLEGQLSEIHSFAQFRQCDSIHQVFNVFDSMEGRALLAEETVATLESRALAAEALAGQLRAALENCSDLVVKWINAEIAAMADRSGAKEQESAQNAADLFRENIASALAATPETALAQRDRKVKAEALREAAGKIQLARHTPNLPSTDAAYWAKREIVIELLAEAARIEAIEGAKENP